MTALVGGAGGGVGKALGGLVGAVGGALGSLADVAGRRTRRRPLHARGIVLPASLRIGDDPDAPGAVEAFSGPAVVRLSRATGLPRPWPDVHGLAVRWERDGRAESLLLSGTGTGTVSRFVLAPRRRVVDGPFTTLMPFRAPGGPVVLGARPTARPDGGLDVLLLSSRLRGPWYRWGALRVDAPGAAAADDVVRFDPVLDCPSGLATYRWAAALRLPAYRHARRAAPDPGSLPW